MIGYHRSMTIDSTATHHATALAPAVALFRSLGDPARLAILQRLATGEARVVELTASLELAQSTVSAHLACLRDCGLVTSRAQGRASYWSLTRPELIELLASAEHLLEGTGQQVALCPTYGNTSPTAGVESAQ